MDKAKKKFTKRNLQIESESSEKPKQTQDNNFIDSQVEM